MKNLFIGIDVSKEKLDVTVLECTRVGMEVSEQGYQIFGNTVAGFRRMLAWVKGLRKSYQPEEMLFCCETTGGYDRLLCDYLYAHGYEIWRESALQIKFSMGVRKGKNDKADSHVIAEYAMRNQDKIQIYQSPDSKIVQIKDLLLDRRNLCQMRTSNKVRAIEIKATHDQNSTSKFLYRKAMQMVRYLDKEIREREKKIQELVKSDEELKKTYDHLKSIKGIGIVNATALIAYTNNFKNFSTARKLASYYGVASFRNISGSSVDSRASVKHLSNSMLKTYITQAAECAIQQKGIYHDYYSRLRMRGKIHGVAVNNVKNKLLQLAFTLVKNDQDYEPHHEELRKLTA